MLYSIADINRLYVATYIVALSYLASVHWINKTSPYIPHNETFKWGDLSTLPFRIHYPKTLFKPGSVTVLYCYLSKRFVSSSHKVMLLSPSYRSIINIF